MFQDAILRACKLAAFFFFFLYGVRPDKSVVPVSDVELEFSLKA